MRSILLGFVIALTTLAAQATAAPQWVWLGKTATDNQTVYFRKQFEVSGPVAKARFVGSCDNEMTVFINGHKAGTSKNWNEIASYDIAHFLHDGQNIIAVEAHNTDGIAAFLGQVIIEPKSGSKQMIESDPSWQVAGKAVKGWRTAKAAGGGWENSTVIAKLGEGPWGGSVNADSIADAVDYHPPTATPVDKLNMLPGFKAELLYSVPKDTQGSWVAMTVDDKGRLITSDQYGALYRVTPPPIGSSAEPKIEKIDINIGSAQGLCYAFNSLYVMVANGQQGVYRVTDTNGDDKFDHVQLLRRFNGGGEHGPHAIVLGPNKKYLYVVAGDMTKLPNPEKSMVPLDWDEDLLMPRLWDASGFMVGWKAPGGFVARTDPEGKTWTTFCTGFRNTYDIAFNAAGDLFGYDADMEWDMNTPWYRPTRLCHIISGGEFGWRSGSGKWPPYYFDSLPPVVDIGPGSPTGLTFGYGSHFPAKYQNALFMCDWSYGNLYCVHLSPDGATYKADSVEKFITAAPLPLTDIVINPKDGAMYFTIGGRRVQSGLYRVTYKDPQPVINPKKDLQFAPDSPQMIRRRLEAFNGHQDPAAIDMAFKYLGYPDRFVRFAARIALEWQPVKQWQDRALAVKDPQASMVALLGLVRTGDKSLEPRVLEALDRISYDSLSESEKLDLLRVYEVTMCRMGRPDDATVKHLIDKFDDVYPAKTRFENAELCQLTLYLGDPAAIAKTLALLEKAPTQEEQMHYAMHLRTIKNGWTMDQRREYFKWFIRAMNYRGGHSLQGFIRDMKKDAVAALTDDQKKQLADLINAKPAEAEQVAIKPRQFVKNWTVDDLADYVSSHLKGRDFDRGEKMFTEAGCFNCHRFADRGGAVGPDLTGVGGRFSVRDLLESVVTPSKEISSQYVATIFTLKNGDIVMGRVINLSGDNMSVETNMLDPSHLTNVNRNQIKSQQPSPISMMPPGLLNTMNKDEIADLAAYLLSRGDRKNDMFKK